MSLKNVADEAIDQDFDRASMSLEAVTGTKLGVTTNDLAALISSIPSKLYHSYMTRHQKALFSRHRAIAVISASGYV